MKGLNPIKFRLSAKYWNGKLFPSFCVGDAKARLRSIINPAMSAELNLTPVDPL